MANDAGVIVQATDGVIVNRIVWSDEVAEMDFGAGLEAVQEPDNETYAIGGTLIDDSYVPPPEPPPPEPPPPMTPNNEQLALYDHENRLRSIEGQPPLTLEDFNKKAQI